MAYIHIYFKYLYFYLYTINTLPLHFYNLNIFLDKLKKKKNNFFKNEDYFKNAILIKSKLSFDKIIIFNKFN
jgi:hypothetical protein